MSDHNLNCLKHEPFWFDDPELWFIQIDAQFFYYNVKDDWAKFNYIIAQLDKHCLTLVKAIVLTPPTDKKYETLKTELLSKLKECKVNKIKEILKATDIEDRKPSEFLQYLKDLAGSDVEEEYIKSVWSSHLPVKVQWVSSFLTSSSLVKLAQLADLALKSPLIKSSEKSQAKDTDIKSECNDTAMKKLTKRIDTLAIKVDNISSNNTNTVEVKKFIAKTATLSPSSELSIIKPKTHKQDPIIICWYHAQFGFRATKCVQPCNFTVCSVTIKSPLYF